MTNWLTALPFQSLNATQKAAILAYLCNELLGSKTVTGYIYLSSYLFYLCDSFLNNKVSNLVIHYNILFNYSRIKVCSVGIL